jgi:hypothetical protein
MKHIKIPILLIIHSMDQNKNKIISILIYNVNFNLNSEENSKASELCNSKFNKLWPKQMNRCKINNCI